MTAPVLPAWDGGSIANLAASVLAAFGVEPPSPPLRLDLLPPDALDAPGGVALLVLDALGFGQLQAALAAGCAPNLARLAESTPGGPRRLTSVFPSTTTAALNSLATALPPAAHGILGHMLWLEEIGAVVNMLTFRPVGSRVALSERVVRRVATVYERLREVGVTSWVITDGAFEGTPFTNLLQEGGRFRGYRSLSQLGYQLSQALADSRGERAFYALYWPALDTLSHDHGPDAVDRPSPACALEMEFIDLMVGKVAAVCRQGGCALAVVADHGQTRLEPARAFCVDGTLRAALRRHPGGGRRAMYLSAGNPAALLADGPLAAATQAVVPMDEAVAAGWFGGPCAGVRSRLGDVLALARPGGQLLYDYGPGIRLHAGCHAGLSEDEMYVPLLVQPAS